LVLWVKDAKDWSMRTTALAILASILPFGTFWAEFRLFREPAVSANAFASGSANASAAE
jgi:hypothetical protein